MILITGATGNNGKEILKKLSGRGVPLRAMVREVPKEIDPDLYNVEFRVADFDDAESLRTVLRGVERAFLVTPSSEKVEEQQRRFAGLAREAGVRHVVYLSQLNAEADSPVRFLRYHAAIENTLRESGMYYTSLRPNLYMQGFFLFRKMIASESKIAAPAGQARISIVDVRDIADVAIAALTDAGHEGKSYDITGPEALTHSEMVAQLSEVLGRPIRFENISGAAMRQMLLNFETPEWQADGLVEDYEHYARGESRSGVHSGSRRRWSQGALLPKLLP